MFYPEDGNSAIVRNVGGCYEPAQRDMAEESVLCFTDYERAVHVARMGEGRDVYRVWWGNRRERDHLGDPGVDGRIILRWIFGK